MFNIDKVFGDINKVADQERVKPQRMESQVELAPAIKEIRKSTTKVIFEAGVKKYAHGIERHQTTKFMGQNSPDVEARRPAWGKHVTKKREKITAQERIKAEKVKNNVMTYQVKHEDINLNKLEKRVKDHEGDKYMSNQLDLYKRRFALSIQ